MLHVRLRRFARVMRGVERVPVSEMGVVGGLFVRARVMMLGGFFVVPGRVLVVFGRFPVMVGCFFRHQYLLMSARSLRATASHLIPIVATRHRRRCAVLNMFAMSGGR